MKPEEMIMQAKKDVKAAVKIKNEGVIHATMDRAVDFLTQLLEADPDALRFLFDVYAPCNEACSAKMGMYAMDQVPSDEDGVVSMIGPLGIINAIFDDPRFSIASVYKNTSGDAFDDLGIELIGFGIWDREDSILLDGGFSGTVGHRINKAKE